MADTVFDDGDGALFALASRVVAENARAGRYVTTAESCTGGMVATAITDAPGSSEVFDSGFVTYSNGAKTAMLGVPPQIFVDHGAVSTHCTSAMALGALDHCTADVAVAVSGVAGPGGGSEEKPVGMVVFSRARRGDGAAQVYSTIKMFGSALDRAGVRRQAALFALTLLLPESDALVGNA